jgi:hypothetical protein
MLPTFACLALLCACDAPARDGEDAPAGATVAAAVDPELERQAASILEQEMSAVESTLDSLPGLILSVRRNLRRYLNDEHVARARALGVPAVADTAGIEQLVSAGRLVRLPDSTQYWVVRELDQSLPYVTPEKLAAVEELGRRFHERLSAAGLPPFRFEISSALRTGDLQRELRARNANASRGDSSHEFGTTIDIAYNEFSPPSPDLWSPWRRATPGNDDGAVQLRARIDALAAVRLDSLGNAYSDHLKGELGSVLDRMQDEGRMWPLYERSQPVFHTTLARRSPALSAPNVPADATNP